ncbi:MAG: hypothetical protein MN733_27435 [Nitrososphaera sp.]|nr:hypothetical protein [Nitrososphaera sp.]
MMTLQKNSLTAVAFCLFIGFFSTDVLSDNDEDETNAFTLSILRRGYVEHRYCVGECAALGDPYRYHVFSASDITRVIEVVIQSIGFSLNPEGSMASIPECTKSAIDSTAEESKMLWTDYLPLDDKILAQLGTTRKQLKLDSNPNIIYEFQIVGCYKIVQDGANTPFSNPRAAYHADVGESYEELYWTKVDLVLTALMRKRGTKGDFVEVKERAYPKLILDSIKIQIAQEAGKIPEKVWPIGRGGEVLF